jgi:hypothetical protein
MFPLAAGCQPETTNQLRERLLEGLRALPVEPVVGIEQLTLSGQWPVLTELAVDLNGVRVDVGPERAWVVPKPGVERQRGPICRHFRITAVPLWVGDYAKPELELEAFEVQFDFLRDEANRLWLRPTKVGGGSIHARISAVDLDRLFLETARGFAGAQGITVDEARVHLTSSGTNTIKVESEISARKLFVKGKVRVSGVLGISPTFEVRLCDLACEGIGPIGAIAAKAIQPQFDRLSDRPLQPFGSWVSGLRLDQCELRHEGGYLLRFDARLAASI